MKLLLLILALYALVCFCLTYATVNLILGQASVVDKLLSAKNEFTLNIVKIWKNFRVTYKLEVTHKAAVSGALDNLEAAIEIYNKLYLKLIPAIQMTTGQSAIFEILSALIPEEYEDYHLLPTISPVRKDIVLRAIDLQIEQANAPAINPYSPDLDPAKVEMLRKEAYKLIVIGIINSGLQNVITNKDTYLQHIAGARHE